MYQHQVNVIKSEPFKRIVNRTVRSVIVGRHDLCGDKDLLTGYDTIIDRPLNALADTCFITVILRCVDQPITVFQRFVDRVFRSIIVLCPCTKSKNGHFIAAVEQYGLAFIIKFCCHITLLQYLSFQQA